MFRPARLTPPEEAALRGAVDFVAVSAAAAGRGYDRVEVSTLANALIAAQSLDRGDGCGVLIYAVDCYRRSAMLGAWYLGDSARPGEITDADAVARFSGGSVA